MSSLTIAGAAMQAIKFDMDTAANNLANASSPGFKEMISHTIDTGYTTMEKAGTKEGPEAFEKPIHVQRGTGSKIVGVTRNMTQGMPHQTQQPLDICIKGNGYFAVLLPDGTTGYTRNGRLQLDPNRNVVTVEGYSLLDNINIPENVDLTTLKISSTGVITAQDPNNAANILPIGQQLSLYTFNNDQGLENKGNYYTETAASGGANQFTPGQVNTNVGVLQQGAYEESNISTTRALTNIIEKQTIYTTITKVVESYQEMRRAENGMYSGS